MEHLNFVRTQLNEASDGLHWTILVLCNMRGTVLSDAMAQLKMAEPAKLSQPQPGQNLFGQLVQFG